MQACRLRNHTVDVTPLQAATKNNGGNGGTADRMAESNGRWNGRMAGMAGMAERQKEWLNGRMAEMDTYVLFMVHAADDDDTDDDSLIFYIIEFTLVLTM